MSDSLNNFSFTFSRRNVPRRGPFTSDQWNDSFTEIATDLAAIANEWNTKLSLIIAGLPGGVEDSSVNAFRNGLDGDNVWVDGTVTSSSDDLTYYDATLDRPATIKEAFDAVYGSIASQVATVKVEVIAESGAMTTAQKAAIGSNIFDSTAVSSSSSLDGKSENNRLNLIQIARDLYGGGYTLDNDSAANLTNSHAAAIAALLAIHNGTYDTDIAVDHTSLSITLAQSDVGTSAPGDDTFAGAPTDLEEDLNQIRAQIKTDKGTAGWKTAHTALYAGGATTTEALLVSTAGSAAKSATNPWGYQWDNVDGLETRLDAVRDFTGQDTHTDATPTYTSTTFVTNGDNLEEAIGDLDLHITTFSGDVTPQLAAIETFVGQSSNTDSAPTYSSTGYVTNGTSLETAIGALDEAVSSGVQTWQIDPRVGSPHAHAFNAIYSTLHRVAPASGINVTLPSVVAQQGGVIRFKVQASVASGINLVPYNTETIDGIANPWPVASGHIGIEIVSDGISDWMVF